LAESRSAVSPTRSAAYAAPAQRRYASITSGLREMLTATLWCALGGWIFAMGLQSPARPILLWGGALPITWGITRGVIGLWHLVNAGRRGS